MPELEAMSDEQQITTLREEIRRVGAEASLLSSVTVVVGSLILLVALAVSGAMAGPTLATLLTVAIVLCAAELCGGAAAMVFRRVRARRIRARLASFPIGALMITVSPLLQDKNAQTRRIAERLLKDLRRSAGVAPDDALIPGDDVTEPPEDIRRGGP
jgi:hypothetical protein